MRSDHILFTISDHNSVIFVNFVLFDRILDDFVFSRTASVKLAPEAPVEIFLKSEMLEYLLGEY